MKTIVGTVCLLSLSTVMALAAAAPTARADEPARLRVRVVAFSPDGKLLAAGTGEPKGAGQLTVWNLTTGKPRFTLTQQCGVPSLAFAPDGKTLAAALYDHTVIVVEAASGEVKRTLRGHTKEARAVAFSPDGKILATASWDRTIKLWDPATGVEQRTLTGHKDRVFSLAFSPDGRHLVSAAEQDGVRVWDVATGKEQRQWQNESFYADAALFADNRTVLFGGNDGTVRVWNTEENTFPMRFDTHIGVNGLALCSATRTLAVCGYSRNVSLMAFTLDAPTDRQAERLRALLLKLDDDSYAEREVAGKEVLRIGFVAESELRRASKTSPSAEVRIRTRRLRAELLSRPQAQLHQNGEQLDSVAFSPDGKLLASGGTEGIVVLWDVAAAKEKMRFIPGKEAGQP